jgi:hypothetical protein
MQQDQAAEQVILVLQVGIQELLVKDIEAEIPEEVLRMLVAVAEALVVTEVQVKVGMQAKAAWADKLESPEILLGMQAEVVAVVTGLCLEPGVVELAVVVAEQEIIQTLTVITDSFNLEILVTELPVLVAVVEQVDTMVGFRMVTAAKAAPE